MIFAKKLILSSVFAIGAFGLIACGSDSKSSTEAGPDQQGDKIVVPDKKDPNITVTEFSSRIAGDEIRFKGQFGLDFVGDPDAQDSVFNTVFTGIDYKVGKGTDASNMVNVGVTISSNQILFPTQNSIDLNSMNSAYVSVNLTDPAFTECGTYSLVVTVTANDGEKDYQRTEIIPFERDAGEYCRTEDTTSQQPVKVEIPMTSCQVELSTNVNPGLSLSTCTAVPAGSPADITFSKAGTRNEPELAATTGAGVFVTPITNGDLPPYADDYEVDMWPEDMNADRSPATAYVSDFKFKAIEGTQLTGMIQNANQIYVAKTAAYNAETGAGFFAFAITEPTEGNNGDYTFKVKVYRVQ
ncbi:hypothetical protein [Fibrobacter sp. UWB5]|jgi:hypothetical protein|uniref:hypothetical protein n=1 Tax=Fibrobacter sp. UWB5 TaxID=1964360 RepID=UPI000B5231A3|nr:hypothetical protein [Fibrobacter sp. UWB5]OWV14285.1 hypothetical protein B7989_02160 [Fibrobacter sp. UWB5]